MKLLTSKFIFATILGHDGGLADEEARVRLALFYARLGWAGTRWQAATRRSAIPPMHRPCSRTLR